MEYFAFVFWFQLKSFFITSICDRTPQIAAAILRKAERKDCAKVTVEELGVIETMSLMEEDITSLKPGDFSGLFSLTMILLGYNKLRILKEGVFFGLQKLEILRLNSNQLHSLPAGVFSGLVSLKKLSLEGNQISTLPVGIFSRLSSLSWLDLRNNPLPKKEILRIYREVNR